MLVFHRPFTWQWRNLIQYICFNGKSVLKIPAYTENTTKFEIKKAKDVNAQYRCSSIYLQRRLGYVKPRNENDGVVVKNDKILCIRYVLQKKSPTNFSVGVGVRGGGEGGPMWWGQYLFI